MKKKTIWKSPNAELKSFKEKDFLRILSDSKKTKEFLDRLHKVEESTNKVKNNAESFINMTNENIDKMTSQLKFDSVFLWFKFIQKTLPHSLNNKDFITELQSFIITYSMKNNQELYEQFVKDMEELKKENENGEVQDK